MPQTTIFISSPSEPPLSPLRAEVHRVSVELGHQPYMWEDGRVFGAAAYGTASLQHCLDNVRSSDIYFLFLNEKGGTRVQDRTVTHLEYIEAINHNKLIYVFVGKEVQDLYFSTARRIIPDFIADYENRNSRNPSDAEMLEYLDSQILRGKKYAALKHVDPYIWFFLYEIIEVHRTYTTSFSPGVPIEWKSILSDILRQGAELVPNKQLFKDTIEQNNANALFVKTIQKTIPLFRISSIDDFGRFLTLVRDGLQGGAIYKYQKIGEFSNCKAICVYKLEHRYLVPVHGGLNGDFSSAVTKFSLNDPTSFVSVTYKIAPNKGRMIFYKPKKNMFYMTQKVNDYVVSCHFEADTGWTAQRFAAYATDVMDAIMTEQANTYLLDYLGDTLGGMS